MYRDRDRETGRHKKRYTPIETARQTDVDEEIERVSRTDRR